MIGNGSHVRAEGLVRKIKVNVQGHIVHLPTYLLQISGANLILGAAW